MSCRMRMVPFLTLSFFCDFDRMLIRALFEEDNPQEAAQEWLENRGPWSEQQAIVLQMIADGHVQMRILNVDDDDSDDESLEDAA